MRYYESYEGIYSKGNIKVSPNQSLVDFYLKEVKSRLIADATSILELGCGIRSLFSSFPENLEVLAIDVSPSAISIASHNNFQKNITYRNLDVLSLDFKDSFDLVLDSHCFHCLCDPQDRETTLKNIFNALKPKGLFAVETMASHKQMGFDWPYRIEGDILYRLFTNTKYRDLKFFDGAPFLPVRRIDHALKIEEDILKAGFKIIYLYVFSHRKIIPDDLRSHPLKSDPDTMQIIAQKP